MMLQGPITRQITATGTDSMGQWTYEALNCKHHDKFKIIMTYLSCQQGNSHTQKSTHSQYMQSKHAFEDNMGAHPHQDKHLLLT